MTISLYSFLKGVGIGLGLIAAIGMQNVFVLKQGILKNHTFVIASLCFLIDTILITAGINGIGTILAKNAFLLHLFNWSGILFLFIYGTRSFIASFKKHSLDVSGKHNKPSLKKVILTLLGVTFLNPHTYLDSCVFMASIATNFHGNDKIAFNLGAIFASFIWFFSLSFGARLLAKLFKNPLSWKILDFMVGCVMFIIAMTLIYSTT